MGKYKPRYKQIKCPVCKGSGVKTLAHCNGRKAPCTNCDGVGKVMRVWS